MTNNFFSPNALEKCLIAETAIIIMIIGNQKCSKSIPYMKVSTEMDGFLLACLSADTQIEYVRVDKSLSLTKVNGFVYT